VRIVNSLRVLRQKRPELGLAFALGIFLIAFLVRFAFGYALKVVPARRSHFDHDVFSV